MTDAPRRFYTDVAVAPQAGAFAVELDTRTARTPKSAILAAPTAALAELIAEEWRGQGTSIAYSSMPATRLAHTAIDGVAGARAATVESVVRYAASDLLCYFADEPRSLVERQQETWRPLIDWAREAHGLAFQTTAGVVHRPQDPVTLERVRVLVTGADDFTLAGLAFGAALFGSAILALAMRDGRLDAGGAIAAARLDDLFQEERWGIDAETVGRTEAMIGDAIMLEQWFRGLAR